MVETNKKNSIKETPKKKQSKESTKEITDCTGLVVVKITPVLPAYIIYLRSAGLIILTLTLGVVVIIATFAILAVLILSSVIAMISGIIAFMLGLVGLFLNAMFIFSGTVSIAIILAGIGLTSFGILFYRFITWILSKYTKKLVKYFKWLYTTIRRKKWKNST